MSDFNSGLEGQPPRPTYRPPIGMPLRRDDNRRIGLAASIAFHVLVVLLIVTPFVAGTVVEAAMESAGGPGPAGGGGGGRGGTGGLASLLKERLQYVQVAPESPAPTAPVLPLLTEQVVPPPAPVPPPPTTTPPPELDVPTPVEPAVDLHLTARAGGGMGTDGSSGNGPGAGGGVGSGVGTGRGSGLGPGTGGGSGSVYTPTPIQLFLPPMPPPARIRPYRLVAVFDIDETGRIVGVDFNPSKDSGYNRKLKDVLWQMRFKPAVTMDGTPVRAKYQMMIEI